MNENIICQLSPAKTLAVSAAPLRELLNFLIYNQKKELLTERARKQPALSWLRIPSTAKELKGVLQASRLDKNGKMYFDDRGNEPPVSILLHNNGVQFWIHYFRPGLGLVNLSFFSTLAAAAGSLPNQTRNITASHEYQWFTHHLSAEFFNDAVSRMKLVKLGDYFIEQVNQTLLRPYSIYFEKEQVREPYKFISGSFERLKEIMTWALLVVESLKREQDRNGKYQVSPQMIIHCGSVKDGPSFEHLTEVFMNNIGSLAVKENVPYTVLREGFGHNWRSAPWDWERRNKHRLYLNLEKEKSEATTREKIAARFYLRNWLLSQGQEGENIIRTWKLEDGR